MLYSNTMTSEPERRKRKCTRLTLPGAFPYFPKTPTGDPGRGAALEKILNYALDLQLPPPDFSPEYTVRLIQWVRSLRRYADSL